MQLHVSRTMDSKKKLEQQLAAVQIELEELQKSVNDLSLDDIEDTKPVVSTNILLQPVHKFINSAPLSYCIYNDIITLLSTAL